MIWGLNSGMCRRSSRPARGTPASYSVGVGVSFLWNMAAKV